jgi:hypothetical protein
MRIKFGFPAGDFALSKFTIYATVRGGLQNAQ